MEASETLTPDEVKARAAEALGLPSDEERGPQIVKTADALKKRAIHEGVVLPSGAIVTLKIPNLSLMIKKGIIPNDLVDAALEQEPVAGEDRKVTKEMILENWSYTEFIVPHMLIDPKIEAEDVEDLDVLDIELLVNIAARRTDTDAIGRQLGGLDTQESFRRFREESSLRALLGGA